nr:hypothetical protein [Marinicella sp. W31]MDC2875712.1 hypothetical protein [Marinicella sp. W31]
MKRGSMGHLEDIFDEIESAEEKNDENGEEDTEIFLDEIADRHAVAVKQEGDQKKRNERPITLTSRKMPKFSPVAPEKIVSTL